MPVLLMVDLVLFAVYYPKHYEIKCIFVIKKYSDGTIVIKSNITS